MDTSDPDIAFDERGICNHCREYEQRLHSRTHRGAEGAAVLARYVEKIKAEGKGREYDCIAGVSGGVDSTFVVYQARQLGLRVLAVHFDNGWNSELAVSNIEKVLSKLNVDLFTYVVDWEEFRDLQLAFLRASTPDSEIPTDHAIYAVLIKTALKHNIRYVLNGMNFATESIVVPSWAYGHSDWRYIKSVHAQFGTSPLRTYPYFTLSYLAYALFVRRLKFISILNYLDYSKEEAVRVLEGELGWRPYGGKHHESIYTRFFQSYILPRKFNIDKRRAHLSNLLHSGSPIVTRDAALAELTQDPCDAKLLEQDREFVIKKLGLNENSFDEIMKLPLRTFRDYRTNFALVQRLKRAQLKLRKAGLMPK